AVSLPPPLDERSARKDLGGGVERLLRILPDGALGENLPPFLSRDVLPARIPRFAPTCEIVPLRQHGSPLLSSCWPPFSDPLPERCVDRQGRAPRARHVNENRHDERFDRKKATERVAPGRAAPARRSRSILAWRGLRSYCNWARRQR